MPDINDIFARIKVLEEEKAYCENLDMEDWCATGHEQELEYLKELVKEYNQ
jgi:hypothetical protein